MHNNSGVFALFLPLGTIKIEFASLSRIPYDLKKGLLGIKCEFHFINVCSEHFSFRQIFCK
jgi:hypothetical protein